MNNFEKICKELGNKKCNENCEFYKKCKKNKYLCAKNEVKQFVAGNKEKLLLLKSETQGGKFEEFCSMIMSLISFLLSVISIYITISTPMSKSDCDISTFCKIICISAIILSIIGIILLLKFKSVYTWRKYIITAVEEIEKDMKKKNRKEKTKHKKNSTTES